MNIDHIGVVVPNIEKAIEKWALFFGYTQMTTPVINTRQQVKVVFLQKENSMPIKLVEPLDEKSPVFLLVHTLPKDFPSISSNLTIRFAVIFPLMIMRFVLV